MACPWDWEPRQPLDFVRAKPDHLAPPFTRVDNVDTFVTTQCTLQGNSGIPGYATPNCSIPNLVPSGVFPYNP